MQCDSLCKKYLRRFAPLKHNTCIMKKMETWKVISCAWTSLSVNICTAAKGSCRIRDFAAKHKQSPSKSTNPFPTYQCCHYGEEIQSSEKRRELSKSSWWFKSVIVTSAMYCDMSTKTTEFMLDELSQLEEEYGVSVVQLQGSWFMSNDKKGLVLCMHK